MKKAEHNNYISFDFVVSSIRKFTKETSPEFEVNLWVLKWVNFYLVKPGIKYPQKIIPTSRSFLLIP